MNNEIKEILDYLSDDSKSFIICGVSYYKISDYKAKVLLDYITNLQEENEKLKETISKIPRYKMEYELEIDKLKKELEELEKYHDFRVDQAHNLQKRINKVIEYLGIDEDILKTCEIYDVNGIEVYKILQGSDK